MIYNNYSFSSIQCISWNNNIRWNSSTYIAFCWGNFNPFCNICNNIPEDDCELDCNEIWGGQAVFDECGICDDDASNDCIQDCAGEWGGNAYLDECGICDDDVSNDCIQDCSGIWGGQAVFDECDTCDNDSSNDWLRIVQENGVAMPWKIIAGSVITI